ncbi:hypothetical protein VPNG_08525 [Cytospora leucostoma]|uniref:Cytochrome P450 n=1 Tax=Cytospora leucostoma TaxID=1230097 RepID=A0A423W547_9PEZI|nr:hypothetical protein VPNG_08525 [Cytospora leucostoma]
MDRLAAILTSSWEPLVASAMLLGILCHQAIRPFEVDSRGWELVITFLSIVSGILVGFILSADFGLADAIMQAWSAGMAFLVGLFGSIVVYRAFFHRLGRFPGPFAARLSNLYHFLYMAGTNMQYHLHVQKLHSRYGDFVRTGPRELTITRASAVDLIYGPNSKCTKATWYDQNSADPDKVGIENVRDKAKHGTRRKPWDKGLGFRALPTYEGRVKDKVDQLITRFGSGKPVNVVQDNIFYAWDVMGDIAFSMQFNMLKTGIEHPAVDGLHWAMATAGLVTTLPWLMNMLRVIPGATGKFENFASWCYEQVKLKQDQLALEKATNKSRPANDVMSWIIQAQQAGDRKVSPDRLSTHPLHLQASRTDNLGLLSDTVGIAFSNFLYFMVKYPEVYRKLQRIVEAVFPGGYDTWTYDKAKSIPYLDYLIHETLRLRPPVPMGFLRQTPPEGLQIDEVYIPGNVNVNVHTWTIHRDERYFKRAEDFLPERWETLSPDAAGSAYLPFQKGGFACVGKPVAMMQLRMLISCVALRYDIDFAPGENGVEFWSDSKETLTLAIGPLWLVFTPKKVITADGK